VDNTIYCEPLSISGAEDVKWADMIGDSSWRGEFGYVAM